jgi:hypothetical protein
MRARQDMVRVENTHHRRSIVESKNNSRNNVENKNNFFIVSSIGDTTLRATT